MTGGNGRSWSFEGWRRGKTFFTADPHLGHDRIIELCDRPFGDVVEMNEAILDGINSVVGTHDTLVILGDTVMGRLAETLLLLKKIRAERIWLVPGNHDRFSLAFRHNGAPETLRNKRQLWRTQYQEARHGIRAEPDRVPSAWGIKVAGRRVLVSHYPYVGDSIEGEGREDRYKPLRVPDYGLPLLHGHVHGKWRVAGPGGRMFNMGVDVNGFKPVSEEEVAGWLTGIPEPGRVSA